MSTASQYQAYNLASYHSPKTRQVVLLYDGMVRFMKQAIDAMENGQIEERFNLLKKVSDIVSGLQCALDMEAGGDVAKTLNSFYTSLDFRVLRLNSQPDIEKAHAILDEIRQMRNAWAEIDKGSSPQQAANSTEAPATPAPASDFSA